MIKNLQNNNNNFWRGGGGGCKTSGLQMFTKTVPKFSGYSM